MLDTREQLDLKSIRDFFTARVIGQDEAVEAMIARIAMLKAGLNDPNKPIGVFLLAGPTGTGKTLGYLAPASLWAEKPVVLVFGSYT